MAGRGRGRGGQFNAITDGLGLARGQSFDPSTEPPPVYPTLVNRPHYPQQLPEHDYMLAVMKDFVNQMKDSQFAIKSEKEMKMKTKGLDVARYSEKIQVQDQ